MWRLRCGIRSDREELFNELADSIESGQMASEKARIYLVDFKKKKFIGEKSEIYFSEFHCMNQTPRQLSQYELIIIIALLLIALFTILSHVGTEENRTQPLTWSLIEGAGQ